jgi:hypothetical protein
MGHDEVAASVTATMFGVDDQVSVLSAIAVLPIVLWELSLGIWLATRGFRPDALARLGSVNAGPITLGAQPAIR